MSIQLGVIADDFTGATDIASFMSDSGWKVVQIIGEPSIDAVCPADVDAVVISLKSRSIPAEIAVKQSLACLRWLKETAQARQIYFKYCSTFDSTAAGNIGQVSDALMAACGAQQVVHCPALPQNLRTVIHAHLFVNGRLLNQSGMENHPINPMRDANLCQVLAPQVKGHVGSLNLAVIQQGAAAITQRLAVLAGQGINHVIADTLTVHDLDHLAQALAQQPLLAGGSGLAGSLAKYLPSQTTAAARALTFPTQKKAVVLSGSCSVMTNRQVAHYRQFAAHFALDVERCIAADPAYIRQIADWVEQHLADSFAPLVSATQPPAEISVIQQQYGEQRASLAVEETFAQLTRQLLERGVNIFIVAGGETSGTVVNQLGVNILEIGKSIAPGVPWVRDAQLGLMMALKSGNFGNDDFFCLAQEYSA
ncbi:Hrp-dependent type III effector protein [Yersinia frederiksenii]|nr:Hrp-dependent type III effector protein [Yersinia frederiksenii]